LAGTVRDWLFDLEASGTITLGLAPIRSLLSSVGHPEHSFTTITIAGTNGKGSVSAMVERGLRAARRRTGRYTSPHLLDVTERVVVDGASAHGDAFDHAAAIVRAAAASEPTPPTFFEATTAIALVAFREAGVEVAVLEVGLGGRLDATNAVDAPLVAITNIGLDHQDYLGHTIEAIAAEKAGVIKAGARVILGRTSQAAVEVMSRAAGRVRASVTLAPEGVVARAIIGTHETGLDIRTPVRDYGRLRLSLPGRHQVDNAVTAVRTLEAAQAMGIAPVDADAVRTALADVRWPGRLDWRRWRGCDVLVDGAHNADGARALAAFLRETVRTPVPIVIGIMRDKAIAEVIGALAPSASVLVCTACASPRAATPQQLADEAARVAPHVPRVVAATPLDALVEGARHGEPIVVAGSLFLAGEVLPMLA
jgi:dihydrofolate synthase/folylpolyglutamate synthase